MKRVGRESEGRGGEREGKERGEEVQGEYKRQQEGGSIGPGWSK